MDKSLYDKNKPKKSLCVSCECSSTEHKVHFEYEPPSYTQKDFGEIFVHVYLNPTNSFFKRLVVATKYLFGYQCKYGAWDESVIRKQAPEIVALFQEMIKDNQEFADWWFNNRGTQKNNEVVSTEDHLSNDE